MAIEETFVAIKPDATKRKLIAPIIQRFEQTGLELVGLKLMLVTRELAEEHYGEHKGKPFFEGLVSFITSGPIVAMVWKGEQSVEIVRKLIGTTDPAKALPGTIRGDFAINIENNVVHASDSVNSAKRELGLFFPEGFVGN